MPKFFAFLGLALFLFAPTAFGGGPPHSDDCIVFAAAEGCEASLMTYVALTAPVATPAPMQNHGGAGDADMRTMVISMGAMTGYMISGMPVTVSVLATAALGGYAAMAWYDFSREHP